MAATMMFCVSIIMALTVMFSFFSIVMVTAVVFTLFAIMVVAAVMPPLFSIVVVAAVMLMLPVTWALTMRMGMAMRLFLRRSFTHVLNAHQEG